ncbi:MAG: 16S rRNA (uracil(1498)-N(3))-methyltransferase [Myxococcales bacterium]|nr:MAG: 16S rRNA (uracil(1498)-N(3))-methyltransferase [Myxococcales bacterium]
MSDRRGERVERLYLPQLASGAVAQGATIALDEGQAHYLVRVLRLRKGDRLRAFDGVAREYAAVLADDRPRRVTLEIGVVAREEAPPAFRAVLAQGLAKQDKLDVVIQKAVELGVARVRPFVSRRAVLRLDAAETERRLDRWRKVAAEACRQCGRIRLAELDAPVSFETLLDSALADGPLLLAYEGRDAEPLTAFAASPGARTATLVVGPEGGFAPEEAQTARERGARLVSLGPRILRTETAGPAFLAIVQYLWGDLATGRPATGEEER